MDNKLEKVHLGTLPQLSQTEIAEFKTRCRTAIKLEQGINGLSLVKFQNDYGENSLLLLSRLIKEQTEFFNVVDNVTDKQAVDIATLLFIEYPNVTIEDCIIMFRYAKTGKPGYEKPMSRLDGRVIFNWINAYLDEKIVRIEELNGQQSQAYKTDPIDVETLKRVSDAFEIMVNKAKVEEKESVKKAEAKEVMTAEKQERYIRENIESFSKVQIENLIKQFKLHHSCLAYDPILELLETQLKTFK